MLLDVERKDLRGGYGDVVELFERAQQGLVPRAALHACRVQVGGLEG